MLNLSITPGHTPTPATPDVTSQTTPAHPPSPPQPRTTQHAISAKVQQLLIYLYTFIAVILMFRFVFSLVGAREETPFVSFVYQLSIPFMIPFFNMFGRPLAVAQFRLEFEVLVALLVYAIVFFGVAKLVSIIFD